MSQAATPAQPAPTVATIAATATAATTPTAEQLRNCPTVFQALGMGQNQRVLLALVGMSALLIATAFGVFLAGRELIPRWFPSVSRCDSPLYAAGACVVIMQVIVFTFYFWAWGHDVRQDKEERQPRPKQD